MRTCFRRPPRRARRAIPSRRVGDARLADSLGRQGHDVTWIARHHRTGMSDLEVLDVARSESRILITNDRDFGELIVRRQLEHTGVILFRLQSVTLTAKEAAMATILREHANIAQEFLVVTERGVRTRRQSPAD